MQDVLQRLRSYEANSLGIEELFVLSAQARMLAMEYAAAKIEPPAWLVDVRKSIAAEIAQRHREILSKRLAEVKARRLALRSREEQRTDLEAEEARLEAALNPDAAQQAA